MIIKASADHVSEYTFVDEEKMDRTVKHRDWFKLDGNPGWFEVDVLNNKGIMVGLDPDDGQLVECSVADATKWFHQGDEGHRHPMSL